MQRLEPKRKLALLLRWYLGQSSRWAREGIAERQRDFQIWCGPAIGRFNQWSANVGLAEPENRSAEAVTQAFNHGSIWGTHAVIVEHHPFR